MPVRVHLVGVDAPFYIEIKVFAADVYGSIFRIDLAPYMDFFPVRTGDELARIKPYPSFADDLCRGYGSVRIGAALARDEQAV